MPMNLRDEPVVREALVTYLRREEMSQAWRLRAVLLVKRLTEREAGKRS